MILFKKKDTAPSQKNVPQDTVRAYDGLVGITMMNITVPKVLNTICTIPVRFASLPVPMEQTIAVVTHVPRLIPIMMG